MAGPSPVVDSRARGSALRAFRSREFTFFWAASLLSVVAFFMLMIARGWLVLELTDSPFMVTAVAGVSQLPSLFLSAVGGVLADRFNRKTLILATEAINGAALLALAALVVTDAIEVWHVFLLGLLNGSAFALGFPARAAIVPNLVKREDMANAVSLSSTMFSGAALVGPALAGYLLAQFGMATAFLVPALVLVPALGLFALLRLPSQREEARQGPVLGSLGEGLAYMRGQAVVLGLMAIALVAILFVTPYQTLLPVFARDILHAGEVGLGLLSAAGGLGAIAGSLAVAAWGREHHLRAFLTLSALSQGVLIVFFGLSPFFLASLVLAALMGFLFQVFMTSNLVWFQMLVPDHLRGRVLSVRFVLFGISPLGVFAAGAAAEAWGTPLATAATGVLMVLGAAATLLAFPALWRAPRPAATEPASLGGPRL